MTMKHETHMASQLYKPEDTFLNRNKLNNIDEKTTPEETNKKTALQSLQGNSKKKVKNVDYKHPKGHLTKIKEAVEEYTDDLEFSVVRQRQRATITKWAEGSYDKNENQSYQFNKNENVAILTGKQSGITIIDIDNKDHYAGKGKNKTKYNTIDIFKNLVAYHINSGTTDEKEATKRFYEHTPYVKSGGGGLHFYVQYIDDPAVKSNSGVCGFKYKNTKFKLGIDIKNNGGIITAPPSIHHTTLKEYKWSRSPMEYPPVDSLPRWLNNLIKGETAVLHTPKGGEAWYSIENLDTNLKSQIACMNKQLPDFKAECVSGDGNTGFNKRDLPTLEQLRQVVMNLNGDRADERSSWFKVLCGIKNTCFAWESLGDSGTYDLTLENGFELADEWSSQSDKYLNSADILKTWEQIAEDKIAKGRSLNYASLLMMLKKDNPDEYESIKLKNKVEKKKRNAPRNTDKAKAKSERGFGEDISALCELNVPDKVKNMEFTHFGQFRDVVKLANTESINGVKGIHPHLLLKYIRACIFPITNGGNMTYMTKNMRLRDGIKEWYFKMTSKAGILSTFNLTCPVINPMYDADDVEKSKLPALINPKLETLALAFEVLSRGYGLIKSYDEPEFVPYLHADESKIDEYTFNLFSGFSLAQYLPAPPTNNTNTAVEDFKQSLMYQHLKRIICNDNEECFEYLLNWIAHMIQKPAERVGANILLYGGQGSGKGTLATFIETLVGSEYYMMYNNIHDFTNKFNGDQQGKLFVFLDEVGDNTKGGQEVHNIIKNKTTEKKIRVEIKGKEAYMINNYARYLSASNFENNLRIEADDRRFLCLHLSDTEKNNPKYFKPLFDEIQNKESKITAFNFFATRNITQFIPAVIPNTKLKNAQKLQALPVVQFLIDLFNKNIDHEEISKSRFKLKDDDDISPNSSFEEIIIGGVDLYKIYNQYAREASEKPKARKYFYGDLYNLGLPNIKAICWKNKDSGDKMSVKGFKLTAKAVEQCIAHTTKNPDFKLLEL